MVRESEEPPDATEGPRPRYRIQAVCARTGIPAATLRAWERRYGIPKPARTASRYRLYGERDVALIRRMAELCASGMKPAEAARLARAMPVPFEAVPSRELEDRLVDAAVRLDDAETRRVLDEAFARRLPAHAYDAVVSPALVRIGEAWATDAITVAHEHLATAAIRERLLARLRETTPEAARDTALLACADEEQHDLGLIGFALHVAAWGIRPIFLGARVPPPALGAAVAHVRPRFVGISLVMPMGGARAREMLGAYASALGDARWILGGPGARSITEVAKERRVTVVTTLEEARLAIFGL